MNSKYSVEPQLYQILPAEFQQEIPLLAKVLDNLLSGRVDVLGTQNLLETLPHIKKIARFLSGKQINYYESLLSFGTNNQFGDINIGDVAGGDIYKLNITLVTAKKEVSHFSVLVNKASNMLVKDVASKKNSFWPVIVLGILSIILACSPFIPTWIPAAGVISAFVSQWFLIEGQKQIGWTIWWISASIIMLLSLFYLSFLLRLL